MPELKIGDEIKVATWYDFNNNIHNISTYDDRIKYDNGHKVYTVEIKKIERVKLTLEE